MRANTNGHVEPRIRNLKQIHEVLPRKKKVWVLNSFLDIMHRIFRNTLFSRIGDMGQVHAYVVDMMKAYTERHEPVSVYKFLFASLELISNSYYPVVERMDKRKDEINALLRQTTTKKHLFALSDLETSMVYLVAAAKQNRMLLEHIKSHGIYRRFDELETEQFEDAMIEARQLVSMTDLIAQVLSQLSGSYNNILNNNLNDNLTVLTIISVLLAVLAVITGFFGMNVPLPLSNDKNAWIYIVVISLIIWGLLTKLLKWLANKK